MAKKNMSESTQPQPAMAKKYKIKNGEKSFTHPVLGIVTQEHMEGPKAEVFMKALQNCEKNHKCKPASEWIEGA